MCAKSSATDADSDRVARIVVVTSDLLFGSRIQQTLSSSGHEVELSDVVDPSADLLVVDLVEMQDLSPLGETTCPVLGYYSHVDPGPRDAAIALGVDMAVPRSRMAREMSDLAESLLTA